MGQVSWRTDDELLGRVQRAASEAGLSLNGFLNRVLTMATSEDESDSEAVRLRHRQQTAGLLAQTVPCSKSRPPEEQIAAARAEAGSGTALSDLVDTMRS